MNIQKIVSNRAFGIVNGITMCISSAVLATLPMIDQGTMIDAGRECAKQVNASLIASCLQATETAVHIASLALWVIVPIAAISLGAHIQMSPPCFDVPTTDETDEEDLQRQVTTLATRVAVLEQRLRAKDNDFSGESDS